MSVVNQITDREREMNDRLLNIKGKLRMITSSLCGDGPPRPAQVNNDKLATQTPPSPTFENYMCSTQMANINLMLDIDNTLDWLDECFGPDKSDRAVQASASR